MSKSVIYKEYDQCPICGDPLIIDGKDSGRLKCGCCGFNVKVEAEVSQDDTERLKAAYDALRSYEFTVAEDRYNLILDDNSFDSDIYAAALFGKLLTEFGIVYIKDFNGITIPTFSEYNPDMLSIKLSDTYEELASCKCDDKVKESYLDTLISDIREEKRPYISKTYLDLTKEKFYEAVCEYMEKYNIISKENDNITIYPVLVRMIGKTLENHIQSHYNIYHYKRLLILFLLIRSKNHLQVYYLQ